MILETGKFAIDESRSNPMMVALIYPDANCPNVCAYMAVGFGSMRQKCNHLEFDEQKNEAMCTKED